MHSLLSEEDQALAAPALRQITALTHEIREIERGIEARAAEAYPVVQGACLAAAACVFCFFPRETKQAQSGAASAARKRRTDPLS